MKKLFTILTVLTGALALFSLGSDVWEAYVTLFVLVLTCRLWLSKRA